MSNLFTELDIEVVRLTLTPKAGGSAVDYYFALDYWPAGKVYATNPVFYPLLAASPRASYGVDTVAGLNPGAQVQIYGDSHLTRYGLSFSDLLKTYEIHNATVRLLYYAKPTASSALTTHSDSANVRQVVQVVGESYDEASGIITLQCSDVLVQDKEISKKLSSDVLPGLNPDMKSAYGAIVFGQSTASGDGIAINAPYYDSKIDGSNRPVAKLFSGWTFPNYPNKAFKRLFAKSPNIDQNKSPWVVVALESDPQTAGGGESVASPVADPPNYGRDLAIYQRGITVTPATDAAKILTATSAKMVFRDTARVADIVDGQHFFNNSSPDFLSSTGDFTIEFWGGYDALHTTSNRYIMRQGQTSRGTAEWGIFFNTSNDNLTFGVSSNGTSYGTTVSAFTAVDTTNVFHVIAYYSATFGTVNIIINNGAVAATGSAVTPSSRNGIFAVGSNEAGVPGFDGTMWMFRAWSRVLDSTEIGTLYNSGRALAYSSLSDSIKVGLRCAYDFDEPYNPRKDSSGGADLTSNSNSTLLSPAIGYDYANVFVPLEGSGGAPTCDIESAESFNSGDTVGKKNTTYRTATTATNNSNFYASLTGGGGATAYWNIDPPLVMPPAATHLVSMELTGQQDFLYALDCYYDSHGGSSHYAINKLDRAANWALQTSARIDLLLYYLGQGDDSWVNGTSSGASRYSYQHLEAKSIGLYDDVTRKTFAESLEFKICVSGLQDDSSGTYTGTPNAVIERPADIILFTLMNPDFGLGISSSLIDLTSFSQAKADCAATYVNDLKMQAVIESTIGAQDFIIGICRQSRMIFYKKRSGLFALKFPRYSDVPDAVFTEAYHRGDFALLSVSDNDYSTVVNDFDQLYARDTFYLPDDPATNKLNPTEKLANELVLTSTASTAGDADRVARLAASVALYGKREYKDGFGNYDSAIYTQPVQNYLCDRYSTLQKRATFRIPRRTYFNSIDLFSMLRLEHTGLADPNGTADKVVANSNGTPSPIYDEGVPSYGWAGGQIVGQVYEIQEEGAWMTITIETIPGYR